MGRMDGKVAIISGGARGMGAEEVRLFAREGAQVVLATSWTNSGNRSRPIVRLKTWTWPTRTWT